MEIINQYFNGFTAEQEERFNKLPELYQEWNQKINVISRKDIEHLEEKHILHSLAIAAVCTFQPGMRVLDIGTGGGFPGIPLSVFFPEVSFVLVDSIGKKIKIVEDIAQQLNLSNVTAINARVEDIKQQGFDFVVSRAVAPLKSLWQWARPKIKKGTNTELSNGLICLKGGDLTNEIFESGVNPRIWDLHTLFDVESFKEKYILHVAK